MNELRFLEIINKTLDSSSFLGNDCAYLDDFDIFVTQDTLVEDVHFSLYTINPYLLGRKSVSVNLSDLAAALSIPKYILVSLSLPKNTKDYFVSELYRGINDVCQESNQMSFSSNQTVNVQIKDDMGNVLDSAEVIIDKIDKVKPTIVASVASVDLYEASVAITSTSDDGGSGLESTPIYSYYIKSSSDSDSAYELKYQGTDTSYTFVDLYSFHSYDIKIKKSITSIYTLIF